MRILILREIGKNSIDDIFDKTDYRHYEFTKGANIGNKLWYMGIVATVMNEDNEVDFLRDDMDADYINSHYDCCIKPEANIFQSKFVKYMDWHIQRFNGVKIPIYVIACGIQANSIAELIDEIKGPATDFINSIYRTGGEFCLRGYETKEFFDKLGFMDAVVTGCPSMFQMGRNLFISDEKVPRSQFKPALNGDIMLCRKALTDYPSGSFFDQGNFIQCYIRT